MELEKIDDGLNWGEALFVGHNAINGVSLDVPKGMKPTLKEQQSLVDGYVQYFEANGYLFILDEEGLLKGKSVNKYVNNLFEDGFNVLVGDVIVIPMLGYKEVEYD